MDVFEFITVENHTSVSSTLLHASASTHTTESPVKDRLIPDFSLDYYRIVKIAQVNRSNALRRKLDLLLLI